jgi:micrococcal nuclease
MTKKTKDLLMAIGLLLVGYFFGDAIAKINNNPLGIKIEPEQILRDSIFKDSKNKTDRSDLEVKSSQEKNSLINKNIDLKEGLVKYIIDGDTIILTNGEKIRYIGIDTPERGQCWYRQAKEFNRKLIGGKKIRLELDRSNRDRYQRLLRYVYVSNQGGAEKFVNFELVKAGLARAKEYKPDIKYHLQLKEAENYAKLNRLGLWGGCEE